MDINENGDKNIVSCFFLLILVYISLNLCIDIDLTLFPNFPLFLELMVLMHEKTCLIPVFKQIYQKFCQSDCLL